MNDLALLQLDFNNYFALTINLWLQFEKPQIVLFIISVRYLMIRLSCHIQFQAKTSSLDDGVFWLQMENQFEIG